VRLRVLGAAGAAPLDGACSAYVVHGERGTVLLDCGPGALERVWRGGLLRAIDAIVLSHMHTDHVLDLVVYAGPVTRQLLDGRRPVLHVPEGGTEVLDAIDAAFARQQRRPTRFEATFDVSEYGAAETIVVGDLRLTFAPTAHREPCFAARVEEGGSALVYGADGSPSQELEELARGADVLILEATYLDDAAAAAGYGHMTAVQAGELAARAGVRRLVLAHLLPGPRDALVAAAARAFGGPIDVASEGLEVEVA